MKDQPPLRLQQLFFGELVQAEDAFQVRYHLVELLLADLLQNLLVVLLLQVEQLTLSLAVDRKHALPLVEEFQLAELAALAYRIQLQSHVLVFRHAKILVLHSQLPAHQNVEPVREITCITDTTRPVSELGASISSDMLQQCRAGATTHAG